MGKDNYSSNHSLSGTVLSCEIQIQLGHPQGTQFSV